MFESFVNFNVPELSKHRKRKTGNLSGEVLQQAAVDLSVIMNERFWERSGWCDMKQEVVSLIQSLTGYVEYLERKNKLMKLHHKSSTPVREISNNIHVQFLPTTDDPNDEFNQLEEKLMNSDYYNYISLSDYRSCKKISQSKKFNSTWTCVSCGYVYVFIRQQCRKLELYMESSKRY